MSEFEQLVERVIQDQDLKLEDIPALDLYMDQVLTLFDEGLSSNKRHPEDKLLTKTMINNYSKEHLLMPVKGKKYSRQHIMQLLCIFHLKQVLSLGDIKSLTGQDEIDFEKAYQSYLQNKNQLKSTLIPQVKEYCNWEIKDSQERLESCLALVLIANYMRRFCEEIIDTYMQEGAEMD